MRERIRTHNGSKRVKSAKDVLFGGFVKNGHPHPYQPPNSENFALQRPFFCSKHVQILAQAPPKFVFE